MAISKIVQNSIDETSVSLGVKITNVQVANSSYTVLDDTAVNVGGGYIVITGAGFKSNPQVIIGQNTACSITFIDSTTIRAEVPAKDAGTYPVYVINTDGAVGIRVPGLTYSGYPTWVTGSTLPSQEIDEAISIQLEATGANTYALQTGSTLPSGMVLNTANGLLTGTVTGIAEDTLYNFTIEAIDTENQESPRAFNVTITVGDEYFNQTTLLLNGDGTSGANNNVFRDSSNNNFAITRNGNTTQGTFSPFSAPDGRWSNYFNGTDSKITTPSSADFGFGTEDFHISCWVYLLSDANRTIFGNASDNLNLYVAASTKYIGLFTGSVNDSTTLAPINQWAFFVVTRTGSTLQVYMNGVSILSISNSTNFATTSYIIGSNNGVSWINAYISNFKIVKGSPWTPTSNPTAPSTSDTNTKLLTSQSNQFVDTNTQVAAKALTPAGGVKVTPFSPFVPTAAYDPAVNGGSMYQIGATDYVQSDSSADVSAWSTDFTIECWIYPTALSGTNCIWTNSTSNSDGMTAGYTREGRIILGRLGINETTSTTGLIQNNTWHHVAWVRSGSSVNIYLNGVSVATPTTTNLETSTTKPMTVGGEFQTVGDTSFPGYISGFRVLKGTAIDFSSVGVPTAPYQASDEANTKLLLNFTNAGILDYTGKNVLETVGDAKVNTAITKYGTGSMSFDGTGDYLLSVSKPDLILSGDFTIEAWIYPVVSGTVVALFTIGDSSLSTGIEFYYSTGGSAWRVYSDNAVKIDTGSAFSGSFKHFAVVRSSGVVTVYIDGVASLTTWSTTQTFSGNLYVGAEFYSSSVTPTAACYIDDLRITKGVARYTTGFTPPTGAHRKR